MTTVHSNWIAIAAMARNRVIGNQGRLPWNIPEEMAVFKKTTLGHTIVMGRKTFESIGKRALPGRKNIVISHTLKAEDVPADIQVLPNLEGLEALNLPGKVYICGGSLLYQAAFPLCGQLQLSLLNEDYKGDAIFPPFEHYFWAPEVLEEYEAFRVLSYKRLPL